MGNDRGRVRGRLRHWPGRTGASRSSTATRSAWAARRCGFSGSTRRRRPDLPPPGRHGLALRRLGAGRGAAALPGRRAACAARETDRYGASWPPARSMGQDMGEVLVSRGLARAYLRFPTAISKSRRRRSWPGGASSARRWPRPRRIARHPRRPAPAAAGGLRDQGQHLLNGRIYHCRAGALRPTRIDTSRGERWFCSEAEAQAAGWRRARR
jgi:hypothetical protein